jgi:hypothetical protein
MSTSLDVLFPWADNDLLQLKLRDLMTVLDTRLETLDAVAADWQEEADRLAADGIDRVNETVQPIIVEIEAARVEALADRQAIADDLALSNQIIDALGGFNPANYVLKAAYNTAIAGLVKQVDFDAAIATRVTIATFNAELANRVRFDAVQAFGDAQKAVARANLASGPRALTGTGNVTVDDRERLIYIPSTVAAGFTLTHAITAVAAGAGFRYRIKSDAPRVAITIDPAGAETIDGQTTLKCLSKQEFTVESDGTKWTTYGRQKLVSLASAKVSAAVASVDFTLPDGYDAFEITIGGLLTSVDTTIASRLAFDAAGTVFDATNSYNGSFLLGGGTGQVLGDGSASTNSFLRVIYLCAPTYPSNAHIILHPGDVASCAKQICNSGGQATLQYWTAQYSWLYANVGRATGLRYYPGSGTFTKGDFHLIGRVMI